MATSSALGTAQLGPYGDPLFASWWLSNTTWEERQWSIVARLFDQIIPQLEGADCTLIADRGKAGVPISEDLP